MMAVLIPANLDYVQDPAVPDVLLTAYDVSITQGRLGAGECVRWGASRELLPVPEGRHPGQNQA